MLYCTQTYKARKKVLKIKLPIATDLVVYICYFCQIAVLFLRSQFYPNHAVAFYPETTFLNSVIAYRPQNS